MARTTLVLALPQHQLRHQRSARRRVSCYDSRTLGIDQFRELAGMAKVHLYGDKGNAVMASREFLMVHRKAPGQARITLPVSAKTITEVFSGRHIAGNTAVFTDSFSGPDTRLYHFTQD